ncbi:uncharacterized protein LOC109838894 [Asparagus officinalis]|uniref:uncharacterized protein LOC109838894 n=1 Tax=Asparagus officinalis TaxID=4686 RepID=UPI00098E3F40|nr:uncharacterized protein LOC109838894 [Asparagus officinalis]
MTLTTQWRLQQNVRDMGIEVVLPGVTASLMSLQVQSTLVERIKPAQLGDTFLQRCKELVAAGLHPEFVIHKDGSLWFGSRICVPEGDVWKELLWESHSSLYSIHPGGTKMYQDLKLNFWWRGMKRDVVRSVEKWLEDHLHLVEFAYNNSFQVSIGMAPFAALYGRKCRSPLSWDDVGELEIFGTKLIAKLVDALRRYVGDPSHVIDFSEIKVQPNLAYEKQPVVILKQREKTLWNKTVILARVMWHPDSPGESTWETESEMRQRYPHMFPES